MKEKRVNFTDSLQAELNELIEERAATLLELTELNGKMKETDRQIGTIQDFLAKYQPKEITKPKPKRLLTQTTETVEYLKECYPQSRSSREIRNHLETMGLNMGGDLLVRLCKSNQIVKADFNLVGGKGYLYQFNMKMGGNTFNGNTP